MTTGQTPEPETPMEDAGGVSGMVNLTINLPDNVRISTVDASMPDPVTPAAANATGTIVAFAGSTAPDGWLLCNGAAVSRATYADLFDVIGTNYGVGNANTTFNLPDLRGRFPLGKDDMGGVSADRVSAADELGGSGGTETHTLTTDEMPAHHHAYRRSGAGNPGSRARGIQTTLTDHWSAHESNLEAGGGQSHNNLPPYQTVSYIIKT